MPNFALLAPPRVAVGGRWHEIEEENRTLVSEVQAWRCEAKSCQQELFVSRSAQHELLSEVELESQHCDLAKSQVSELESELMFLRKSLSDVTELSTGLEQRMCETSVACERHSSECAVLQHTLDEQEYHNSGLQSLAARAELRASREESGRHEAETKRDCLLAELNLAEGRLVNRATHVDLLLRDKERLWGQLSRARRRIEDSSTKTCKAKGGTHGQEKENVPSAPKTNAICCGSRREQALPIRTGSRPNPSGRSASAAAAVGKKSTNCQEERCLELERELWHLQRALARERTGHEQAREALRIRGWRAEIGSPSSAIGDASREEELTLSSQ